MAIDRSPAFRPPWASQRFRRHRRIQPGDGAVATGLLVDELDLPVFDVDAFKHHGAGRDLDAAAAHPVQRTILQQTDLRFWLFDTHIEDARFS